MRVNISGKRLMLAGAVLFLVTVLDGYLLEVATYESSLSLLSQSFEFMSVPLFLVSTITFCVGCGRLLKTADSQTCFKVAGLSVGVFAAEILMLVAGPFSINFHGWSAMLCIPLLVLLPLALVFAIAGEIKKARSRPA